MKQIVRIGAVLTVLLCALLVAFGASADRPEAGEVQSSYANGGTAEIEILSSSIKPGQDVTFRYTITEPEDADTSLPIVLNISYLDEAQYENYLSIPDKHNAFWIMTVIKSMYITKLTGKQTFRVPEKAYAIEIGLGRGTFLNASMYGGELNEKPIPVQRPEKVTVSPTSLNLYPGQKYQLEPAQTGTSAKGFKYTSSNASVASVSGSGRVEAKKAGSAVITVTGADKMEAKVKVKVNKLPSVKLAKSLKLSVNQSAVLAPTAKISEKATLGSAITWSFRSSGKKCVSVDKTTGLVVARKKGTATITVTGNLSGAKLTLPVRVTVK